MSAGWGYYSGCHQGATGTDASFLPTLISPAQTHLHHLPFHLHAPLFHSRQSQNCSNSGRPSRCCYYHITLARATCSYADTASSHLRFIVRDGVTLQLYAQVASQLARPTGKLLCSSHARRHNPSSSPGRTSDGASLHPLDRDRSSQLALHCLAEMRMSTHYCRPGLYH